MPKKKAGKKGAKIIDGLATNEMSRDQLMGHVKRMQTELDREREERNFFMLEREKLFSLWNMTLEQIGVEKDQARLIQVQLADGEKEREEEMKIQQQKLRYLMMDHSQKLARVRLQHLEKMKRLQDETSLVQKSMGEGLKAKVDELGRAKSSICEIIRRIRNEYMDEISRIRVDCSVQLRSLEAELNRKLFAKQRNTRVEDVLANLDLAVAEESEDLLDVHEKQLMEMRDFYNGITTNNLAIISALQNDLEESKANENGLKMEIKLLKHHLHNKRVKVMAAAGIHEVQQQQQQQQQDLNKQQLEGRITKTIKAHDDKPERKQVLGKKENVMSSQGNPDIRALMKNSERKDRYVRMLESKNEILFQQALQLGKERDDLKATFARAVIEIQRKSSMSKLISELKLNNVRNSDGGGSSSSSGNRVRRRQYPSQSAGDVQIRWDQRRNQALAAHGVPVRLQSNVVSETVGLKSEPAREQEQVVNNLNRFNVVQGEVGHSREVDVDQGQNPLFTMAYPTVPVMRSNIQVDYRAGDCSGSESSDGQ